MKLKGILIVGAMGAAMIVSACSQKTPSTQSSSGALVMPAKYNINNSNRMKSSSNKNSRRVATKREATKKRMAKHNRSSAQKKIAKRNRSTASSSLPYMTN